jgi:hypothetical protein
MKKISLIVISIFVFCFLLIIGIYMLCGCTTYSVTMVHSEGTSTDAVDATQTQSPVVDVSPTVTVPTSVIP